MDIRIRKWARLLVDYSLGVKEGEQVLIRGTVNTVDLVKACFEEVLKRGAHPIVRLSFDGQSYTYYRLASEKQLKFISEIDRVTAKTINGLISIIGESNTKELTNVDHKKVAMARAAYRGNKGYSGRKGT